MPNRYVEPGGLQIGRMVRSSLVGIVVFALLMTWACGIESVKPDAGHEAVLIEKPVLFGHGGVDPDPVKTITPAIGKVLAMLAAACARASAVVGSGRVSMKWTRAP